MGFRRRRSRNFREWRRGCLFVDDRNLHRALLYVSLSLTKAPKDNHKSFKSLPFRFLILPLLLATRPVAAMQDPAISSSVSQLPEGLTLLQALGDPFVIGTGCAGALSIAAIAWGLHAVSARNKAALSWTKRLADMEARLEKSEAVLSAHRGLILVWDESETDARKGWGKPRILGGPAALASLMSFASAVHKEPGSADKNSKSDDALEGNNGSPSNPETPVDRLLNALGNLTLKDENAEATPTTLKECVADLRMHGLAFSGAVVTFEGRTIDVEGRIAGGQAALWLTDPIAAMTEDGGMVNRVRHDAADLHSAFVQLETAPVPAWRRGPDLKIVWANPSYVETVEATTAALVYKDQIELDSAARRLATKAAKEKKPQTARIAVNVRGDRRIMEITETPAHDGAGAGVSGFAIDVTELEKTKSDLGRHLESNKRTLDQIPTAVAIFGVNQELSYYNSAFRSLWGFETAELDARPSHGEILDKLRNSGRLPEHPNYRLWRSEQLALYTDEVQTAGNSRTGAAPDDVWALPNGRTMRVARAHHPLGGVVLVFEDITERLKFETLHNTQIKVQRATLNNLSEGVATFGADGRLKLYNDAFKELWSLDKALLENHPHIEKILGTIGARITDGRETLSMVRNRITSMRSEDRTSLKEAFLSLGDGRTFAFGTEPLPDGATLIHFLDVTDSREREKELQERNAFLEEIDRQKSKFVDHVSYQLRTPLNTIIGFSEMIDGQMFGVLNERQKDYVSSVLTAAYSLKDLIADIMDLAAIDAGKMTLERQSVDIKNLLTNAAAYAALKAEDTQVELKVNCPRDIGSISADERRLKQVLFNLLSNAFAYTGAGGTVNINAERVQDLMRITVEDSGRGVSTEDQAKAFDPFESSGPSSGAGLGLALVQRFISLHGGWVHMESMPGKGTRVTCFLPASIATSTTPENEAFNNATSSPEAPQDSEKNNTALSILKPNARSLSTAKIGNTDPGEKNTKGDTVPTRLKRKARAAE
ncbi:MAG: ATP-binding protein [Pseudomonadota bacterium]